MNSVLVEPDGLVSDTSRDAMARRAPIGRFRPRLVVFASGLLASVFLFQLVERPEVTPGSEDDRLIQAHLDAWYGGDFETADSFRSPERVRTGPSERRARGEVEYQAMLQAHAELLDCEELPPETVRCDVAYSNLLNEAVGEAPVVVAQQFGIRDGLLLFVAGPYLEDEDLTASFRDYANRSHPSEYQDACVEEPNLQSPDCAAFKLSHLSDWAAGHKP
jgi:hypothetical protein